jgi:PBP1b-binding outer membrane lipoprotein LpoB
MRRFLAIALSALMLSGCMAEWKSNKTGPRWKEQPAATPFNNPNPGPGAQSY